MEVYEVINEILISRSLSKRDFAKKLRSLQPKLKSTSEIPTEKVIYAYLNGTLNLKIELISYIAEALNIKEQNLFDQKYYNELCIKNRGEDSDIYKPKNDQISVKEPKTKYEVQTTDSYIQKVITLLPYAPRTMLLNIIEKLEKIKNITKQL